MEVVDYHEVKLPARCGSEESAPRSTPGIHASDRAKGREKPLIRFEDVHFRYGKDNPDVLNGINFEIHYGDVIAILGHNGSGKTTLVKHALGLLKPTEGKVLLEGKDTRTVTVAQAAHTVGYVFQSPSQMLFAPTVQRNWPLVRRTWAFPSW